METGPHIRLILWKAAKAVEKIDKARIAKTGLGLSDFTIMEALLHKGPLPINQIGEKNPTEQPDTERQAKLHRP